MDTRLLSSGQHPGPRFREYNARSLGTDASLRELFEHAFHIGEIGGADGVKLEEQVLITETGYRRFSRIPCEASLL